MTKNVLVKHNLETNQNFNFKGSKMLINIHNKHHRNIVESSIIFCYIVLSKTGFFLLIFFFSQISAKKLQDPLFELVRLHYLFFIIL